MYNSHEATGSWVQWNFHAKLGSLLQMFNISFVLFLMIQWTKCCGLGGNYFVFCMWLKLVKFMYNSHKVTTHHLLYWLPEERFFPPIKEVIDVITIELKTRMGNAKNLEESFAFMIRRGLLRLINQPSWFIC